MFRRICWKHGILLIINSVTDPLIIVYRKFPNKYSWERHHADTFDGCFNSHFTLRQLTDLNFKMVLSLLAVKISKWFHHRLNFKCCVVSTCRDTFWTQSGIPDGTFVRIVITYTAWKVSKYRVISGPYFAVFSPNTGKYEPEITPYLDTFHAMVYKLTLLFYSKNPIVDICRDR